MSAPTDLEDLGHGRGQLRAAPAASVRRLDVLLGRPLDINRAYADYDQQMAYYLAYRRYLAGGPWAPLALHPDKSWHCKGMALDTDDRLGATFREHGWLFEVDGEPWHGQYYTSLDKHYGEPASGGNVKPLPTPTPTPEEEEEMFTIYRCGAAIMIVGGPAFMQLGTSLTNVTGVDGQETLDAFVKAGAKVVDIADRRVWDVLRVNIIAGMA